MCPVVGIAEGEGTAGGSVGIDGVENKFPRLQPLPPTVAALRAQQQATLIGHQNPEQWYCWWLSAGVSMGEYGLSCHDKYEYDI